MHRLTAWLAVVFLAACAAAPHATTTSTTATASPLDAKLDAIGLDALKSGAPSVAIAVAHGAEPLVARAWGRAEVENDVAATADSVYLIGSVTKQFTAAAIMQLVEQGKLAIDDPVTKYLPDFPTQGHVVTLRQLLTHTSGIHSYTDESMVPLMGLSVSPAEIVARFAAKPFEFEPGTKWQYSNSNYILLGMIIEKVSGESYATYLKEHVFARAGLEHTAYCDDATIVPRRVRGYSMDAGKLIDAPYLSMTLPYAAGALCSTVGDLVLWTRALHAGKVVSPASLALMTTPVKLSDGTTHGYGFGLGVGNLGGHAVIGHGGGINGFVSQVDYYPKDDLIVVVLINTEADAAAIADRAARAALGIPEPKALDLPVGDARAVFAGAYQFKDRQVIAAFDHDHLIVMVTGQEPLRFLYQGEGKFVAAEQPKIRVEFHVPAGGTRADEMTVHFGNDELRGPRAKD